MTDNENHPHFLIFGCGGAGITILDRIEALQNQNIRTVAIDTNKKFLEAYRAQIKIPLEINNPIIFRGEGDPDQVADAVLAAKSKFSSLIEPSGTVFVIAGLGRGVGTGAAPQIAKIARDRGALMIAIAVLPFCIQEKTVRQAWAGLKELLKHADSVIVLDNQLIRDLYYGLSVDQEYARLNGIIVDVIKNIIHCSNVPSLINLNHEDFEAIFRNKGLATILTGKSREDDRNKNESVVRNCMSSPLFNIDYRSATGSLVLIIGGYNVGLYDAEVIASSVTDEIDPHADVVWSAVIDESMRGEISALAIMTGIRVKNENSF